MPCSVLYCFTDTRKKKLIKFFSCIRHVIKIERVGITLLAKGKIGSNFPGHRRGTSAVVCFGVVVICFGLTDYGSYTCFFPFSNSS